MVFLPGLELSAAFYRDAVEPLLRKHFAGLEYSAARIGSGSEVLGFDTERSADHEWGPRLQVFLRSMDAAAPIVDMLAEKLPKTFLGYPTNFVPTDNAQVRVMAPTDGPVYHRVRVADLATWFTEAVGFDPRGPIAVFDWLATPTQLLAEATGGAVFHDGLGELVAARARIAWYPTDVWRHVLAGQWHQIAEEEAFVGRCGEVGDELGSAVVAARLVRHLMRLSLLMARRYPPYSKWLGSAFARLPVGGLGSTLAAAVAATGWRDRESRLADAYRTVAVLHNKLGLTDPVDPGIRPFHDRPYRVLMAGRFTEALAASIIDPEIRALPLPGAIDQFADNPDVQCYPLRARAVTRALTSGDTSEF